MEQLKELQQINPWIILGALITILVFWSFIQELLEKTIGKLVHKFGIKFETQGMRQRREDHELLIKVSENLVKLQERHESDEKEFRNNLNNYMEESRKDRKALHDEMKQYSTNRVNDRQQSLQIQKELKDSIKGLVEGQKDRDAKIENLTDMFVDKEVDDYRWEIINFATKVSEGRPCNKDSFKHCLRTYEKYEALLEKYGLENGEVEISMDVVNEAYKEKMKNGF